MPAQVLARLADISRLEAAVTEAAGRAAAQPDERPSRPDLAGFRVAAEMGGSYVGTWHLLLALIRDRQSVPARALAGLADLGQVETAVTDVMNSPGFARSIPEGAAFGFNWRQDDGRPWIHVSRPGDPRAALSTALVSLGRPPLT